MVTWRRLFMGSSSCYYALEKFMDLFGEKLQNILLTL